MNEREKIFYATTSYMLNQFFKPQKLKPNFLEKNNIRVKIRPNLNISESSNDKRQIKGQKPRVNPIMQRNLERQRVEQYYKQAIKYYQLAAEQGYAKAQYSFDLYYRDTKNAAQDRK